MMTDNGEIEFSNQELFSGPNIGDLNNCSMDSFFEEILIDTHACTHTHTCNPPGPDNSHTHTCYHVHTKMVPATPSENKASTDDTAESTKKKAKKRPLGNREAVRKYREKKKAKAASLEDEAVRLRSLNQQLLKRLQGQAVLEAEVARLKRLLVDIRGRIEGEIGSFPYQRPVNVGDIYQNIANSSLPSAYAMNPCDMHCDNQGYCLHPDLESKSTEDVALDGIQAFSECEFENLQCLGIQNTGLKSSSACGLGSGIATLVPSSGNERNGVMPAATAS